MTQLNCPKGFEIHFLFEVQLDIEQATAMV